jgi:hypothetical protein
MWRLTCSSSHCAVRPASPPSSRASTSRTVRRGNRSLHTCHAPWAPAAVSSQSSRHYSQSPGHYTKETAPHPCKRESSEYCIDTRTHYLVEEMERNRGAVHLGRLPPNWNAEKDEQYVQKQHPKPRHSREWLRPPSHQRRGSLLRVLRRARLLRSCSSTPLRNGAKRRLLCFCSSVPLRRSLSSFFSLHSSAMARLCHRGL